MKAPPSLNLRDLGGLPTRNTLTLATGRVYRSGEPARFDSMVGHELARALGLRTIVDLRTSKEVEQRGTVPLPLSCRHLHRPLFENALPHWTDPPDDGPRATATRYLEMLHGGTRTLVDVVQELGERAAYPFLIHCAAGRDRTGIVVACVLDLLDVTDEAIAFDYALSDQAVNDGGRAHPETMLEFLTLLRKHHGSTRELLKAHSLTQDALDRVTRNLLAD